MSQIAETVKLKDIEKEILSKGRIRGDYNAEIAGRVMMTFQLACVLGQFENDTMKYASRFLDPSFLSDVIEERTVESKCGYLPCWNDLRDSMGKLRDPAKQTIMPWQRSFCQRSCYQASRFYQEQLSTEPMSTREDVLWYPYGEMSYEQEILLLPEVEQMARINHKSVPDTITDIIRNQHMEAKLSDLFIDDSKGDDASATPQTVKIHERQT